MAVEGTDHKVEIVTDDYELTVNGVPYGRVDEGDVITVENAEVYRNGARIRPVADSDQPVGKDAEQGSGGNGGQAP